MRSPFSLYKKQTKQGSTWHVRFWDWMLDKYVEGKSTGVLAVGKKERRGEAEARAREMLAQWEAEAKARKMSLERKIADTPLIEYLENFWKPDSPYVMECALVRKKPLSSYYVYQNAVNVLRYVVTFPKFEGITLQNLASGLLRDWIAWMASREGAAGRMLSGRRVNAIVQTVRVAVRYAVDREELYRDPFHKVKQLPDTPKAKGVISCGFNGLHKRI